VAKLLFYLIPFIPLITRTGLAIRWRNKMKIAIPEEAQARNEQRATVLSLAGFSFTVVSAIVLLDNNSEHKMKLAVWFVLVSFVVFLAAANLQSYKSVFIDTMIYSALVEIGTLSLSLALAALICRTSYDDNFKTLVISFMLSVWVIDHVIRLRIEESILSSLELE
jgi:ABC-type spermidine/putrescine transport system permease subunit I